MPRPSIKEERQEQILIAFEVCVARFGLEGATLEQVAEEAGLARALIRHNVGNREALIEALTARFLERSGRANEELVAMLPKRGQLKTLTNLFFDPAYADTQLMLLSEALIAASANDPALAKQMRGWTMDFVKVVESVVRSEYPNAPKPHIAAVATGLVGIYFNTESLTPLGKMPALNKASRKAADILIQSLE